MLTTLELTGRTRSHITQLAEPRFAAHPEAAAAFFALREAARKAGFDLLPFSSFRDFDTQCRIWNHKFTGRKPLYDENGVPRPFDALSPDAIVSHILNWSALPGGSRHHWGSEIDVVDGMAMPEGYHPKLLPEETAPGGLFFPLHSWLDENMGRFGFFRPYDAYRGGMFPEPWHLSYAPVSLPALDALTMDCLEAAIKGADIQGKEFLLPRLPEIFHCHILNVAAPTDACRLYPE